ACAVYRDEFGRLVPTLWVLLVLLAPVASVAAWETARKIRIPEDETDYGTYSKLLGWRLAALLPAGFIAAGVACLAPVAVAARLEVRRRACERCGDRHRRVPAVPSRPHAGARRSATLRRRLRRRSKRRPGRRPRGAARRRAVMIPKRDTHGQFVLAPGVHSPPELIGGKAHGLQQLAELGLAVPRWATVTTDAMAAVLAGVQERIEEIARAVPVGDAAAAQRASPAIARLVEGASWPPAFMQELEAQLGAFRADRRLAVRSSAVGEDGTAHSFAGQLTTELNLGPGDVAPALRRCWAGAFSASAILYRQALGLAAAPVRVAVVIQEMVDARVSGVAFTADPLTGAPALVVTAAFGLGLGVVSDTADGDTYVRELGSEQWRVTARRKAHQIVPRSNGAPGVERAGVPLGRRDAPTLSEAQLDALAAVLRRIDASAGRPQDVEWAFDGNGTLWIL